MKNILLVIAWTWIAVPLGWGVYQSVQKSIPLFNGPSVPSALNGEVHNVGTEHFPNGLLEHSRDRFVNLRRDQTFDPLQFFRFQLEIKDVEV
jgi:hypothetical protein